MVHSLPFRCLVACCWTVLGCSLGEAQARPAASRAVNGQMGAAFSYVELDYISPRVEGLTVYGDLNFSRWRHVGLEGVYHNANILTPRDIGETSYLAGPRVYLRRGRFEPYARGMLGVGRFYTEKGYFAVTSSTTHKLYAFGAGVDLYAPRHVTVRLIDFEYQSWPGFGSNGLTPSMVSAGAAYRF